MNSRNDQYLNYDVFDPALIPLHIFEGPKVGEKAVDFVATALDGSVFRLSEQSGKTVVLEMGSYTCPMFHGDIVPMNNLKRKYPDVIFLVLYIREAHPGGKISGHRSFDDKMVLAKRLKECPVEDRVVLVDDVAGSAHQKYGSMPNSVHIINPDGFVAFRSDWNNVVLVDQVLADLQTRTGAQLNIEHFPKKPPIFSRNGIPVILRGGWSALWDMITAIPGMIHAHRLAAEAYPPEKTFSK